MYCVCTRARDVYVPRKVQGDEFYKPESISSFCGLLSVLVSRLPYLVDECRILHNFQSARASATRIRPKICVSYSQQSSVCGTARRKRRGCVIGNRLLISSARVLCARRCASLSGWTIRELRGAWCDDNMTPEDSGDAAMRRLKYVIFTRHFL